MKYLLKKTLFIVLLLLVASNAFSYVLMYGKKQRTVKWPSTTGTVNISFNTQNSKGIDGTIVRKIVNDSVNEWNNKSLISVNAQEVSSINTKGLNEIYFSDDPSLFNGTLIAGVTLMSFKDNTSEIIETDILLNDQMNFSSFIGFDTFLGNVITHEIGHALGLGHSLVSGASMFYALTHGQYKLDSDDAAGLFSLYPNSNLNKSEISGNIIGSKSLIPIFGTHVQAYSKKTGKIAASSISETDGSFKIMGLDPLDTYYLYVAPSQNLGLGSKYVRARSDFCENSESYRGSFFQSCNKSFIGHPQEISLEGRASLNVGKVTVRCALDTPEGFLEAKTKGVPYVFLNDLDNYSSKSFVGYFNKAEVAAEVAENHFEIDLTKNDYSALDGNYFLEIKIRNQPFYSPFGLEVAYEYGGVVQNYPGGSPGNVNPDYFNSLDKTIYLPISKIHQGSNLFRVSLKPRSLVEYYSSGNGPNELYFPGGIASHESMYFYLVDVSLVKSIAVDTYIPAMTYSSNISDNSYCADAKNTYRLSDSYLNGEKEGETRKVENATSCGSIDLDGQGPGDSGLGFFVGLILTVILAKLTSRYSKLYLSKHVGKIA